MTDTILKQVIGQDGIDIYDQNAISAITCEVKNLGTEFACVDVYVLIGGINKSYRIAVYDNLNQAKKAIEMYSKQSSQRDIHSLISTVFRFPSIKEINDILGIVSDIDESGDVPALRYNPDKNRWDIVEKSFEEKFADELSRRR